MHDCLKNKPIQKWEQMRKRFWLFAKRLKSLDCVGFHFFQEGVEPWILILFFKKKNNENTNIWKGRTNFSVKFALRIEVEILFWGTKKRLEQKAWWAFWRKRPYHFWSYFYYSLSCRTISNKKNSHLMISESFLRIKK